MTGILELPRTMAEFEMKFPDEHACIDFVRRLRWPDGFQCPRCDSTEAWRLRSRPLDECQRCGHQVSLTAGTLFARTRKPIKTWLRLLADFLIDKRGASAAHLARRHGLSYQTVWTWLHKVRSLMDREGKKPLNDRVEADVMVLPPLTASGKLPVVVGAIERVRHGCGRLRLGRIQKRNDFVDFLGHNASRLTMVKSERFVFIDEIRKRYGLLPYPFDSAELPGIDNAFQLLRRQVLGTYHGAVSRKHLQRYLDEFVFRFNRRTSGNRWLLVLRALEDAFRPVTTYQRLVRPNLSEVERPVMRAGSG